MLLNGVLEDGVPPGGVPSDGAPAGVPAEGVLLLDSIGYVSESQGPGVVIVCGSHGGTSAARYVLALTRMPRAVFFNDAGVGKEHAGIAGLPMLDARGVPCAVYSHDSARIGDAADGLENGRITHVNDAARRSGIGPGQSVREAVAALVQG